MLKEITVTSVAPVFIGQAEDIEAATGCTVVYHPDGMPAGLDVRGGGPALRESGLLNSLAAAERIHAVLLAGGSAFGLDAAGGVQRYLEERGVGYDCGVCRVPLVCQADIFDLAVGRHDVRPDADMAYRACVNAEKGNYRDGCFGAGTGATIGKLFGTGFAMKSGVGSYAVRAGDLRIGAIAAVNCFGDVTDPDTHEQIGGLLSEDGTGLRSTLSEMLRNTRSVENKFTGNTTIGVILTNAAFTKVQLNKLAAMAQNGLAKTICPVHTSADGDSLFALSKGDLSADLDLCGTLAAHVTARAVANAVRRAEDGYGFVSSKTLLKK